MKKVYLVDVRVLAHFPQAATPDFWDQHWQIADLRRYLLANTGDSLFVPAVKRHLPVGGTVLEGGCGRGQLVHGLQSAVTGPSA